MSMCLSVPRGWQQCSRPGPPEGLGLGPGMHAVTLLSTLPDSDTGGPWGMLQETLLLKIYPFQHCLFCVESHYLPVHG